MRNNRAEETATGRIAQALAMFDAFASVGTTSFDVTLTNLNGDKKGYLPKRSIDEIRRTLRPRLEASDRLQTNFIVRPRSTAAKLIQLDDLDQAKADRASAHGFLLLETSPGNFQAWVAVKDTPADFARRLRKGAGADPTASGSTRVAGSRNFKTKYAPDFPLVELARANAGNVVTAAVLELVGLVAQPDPPPVFLDPDNRPTGNRRRWPSYARCVQNAPPVHQGDRPDVSRADFTWAMTAIDWGWSIEDTAKRLMQESNKARENGEVYARVTAENAAAAVGRRRRPVRTNEGPG